MSSTSAPAPAAFERLRPRLMGIAYRMLGSRAEAEEVVQDTWLRWHGRGSQAIDNPEAWLVTVATRLSIDRLRSARLEREHYPGVWLPEPQWSDAPASPEHLLERAGEVSVALLVLLERLSPSARAAYLLREVFEADYGEIASVLGRSEAACRQLVSRAKAQLHEDAPRRPVSLDAHQRLLERFAEAASAGSLDGIKALLAEDAELLSDGGGKVPSFGLPLVGAQRIAQLYFAAARRHGGGVRLQPVTLNGEPGLLRFIDGQLESAQAFQTDGQRIVRVFVQRNPDKLARLAGACKAAV